MPRIALYDRVADNKPQAFDYTWDELVSMLTVHDRRVEKDGPLWSPVRIEGLRANENVFAVTCAVFDCDTPKLKPKRETLEEWRERVRAYHEEQLPDMADAVEGYDYVAYSTHSHEPGATKLRLVLRLSREVSPGEWPKFWRALVKQFRIPADESRKDLSGIYYLPSAAPGAEVIAEVGRGDAVDVDEVLRGVPDTSATVSDRGMRIPRSDLPGHAQDLVDLDRLRARIKESAFGATVLSGEPIGDGRGYNHEALKNTLNDLARVTLDFAPEAVLEVLQQGSFAHPDHYGTDPVEEFWLMFPGQRDYWEQRRSEANAARAAAQRFVQRRLTVKRDKDPENSKTETAVEPAGDPEPEEEEPVFQLTDSGNAERLVYLYGSSFLCVARQWFVWTEKRFDPELAESVIQECAKETIRSMPQEDPRAEDEDTAKLLNVWAQKSESARARRDMIVLAQHEPEVRCAPGELDRDPMLLNLLNCTVDLRAGTGREHRKEDKITKLARAEFLPEATAPLWASFLLRAMGGDAELVSFLQRFAGYCLTGDVGEQVFLFLWGEGSNGKSTFCETLVALLGDYARDGAPDLLIATHGERHPTELADLQGRRLVVCQETEAGKRLAEGRVKQLTGGDRITARRMGKDFFEFAPTHKLILSGNHKPQIRGVDLAIWRRVLLVPFEVTIPKDERDKRLPEKLLAERSGILNWLVAGCLEWQRVGLKPPPRVVAATDAYKTESDTIGDFLREVCVEEEAGTVLASTLYSSYKRWIEAQSERPLTQRALAENLDRKGFRQRHTNKGNAWGGLRFRTPQDSHLGVVRDTKQNG